MPVRLPDAGSDKNVWITFNDMMRIQQGEGEYIEVVVNGDEPPTVKQYTRFWWYNTNTYTPAAAATGNNVFPASVATTYLESHGIFEDGADTTFAWEAATNGETFPAKTDGTWYLYCSGGMDVDENSKGKGLYNVSKTETPTWAANKGGYISTSGYRVLAEFTVTGGTVALTRVFNDRLHRDLNGDIYLKNNTTDKDLIFSVNDGGTVIDAVTIDASSAGDLNINTGDLKIIAGDYLVQGSKYAFASSAAPLAGMFFNVAAVAIEYRDVDGDVLAVQRVSAASEPYFRWYDLAGNELIDWDASDTSYKWRDAAGNVLLDINGNVDRISCFTDAATYDFDIVKDGGAQAAVALRLRNSDATAGKDTQIRMEINNTTGVCQILFGDSGSDLAGRIMYDHGTAYVDAMRFFTATAENFRIEGDGGIFAPNLLDKAVDGNAEPVYFDTVTKELYYDSTP